MSKSDNAKVDLTALKNRFKGGCVPSGEDFTQLIDVAALSFRPGEGLTGGDATDSDSVDLSKVKVLSVLVGSGVAVTKEGVAVALGDDTGLCFTEKDSKQVISLKPPKDKSLTTDGGLAIKAAPPLSTKPSLSIDIDKELGLTFVDGKALCLNVNKKTVDTDSKKVFIKCKPGAGLMIDANGYLSVDIAAVTKTS